MRALEEVCQFPQLARWDGMRVFSLLISLASGLSGDAAEFIPSLFPFGDLERAGNPASAQNIFFTDHIISFRVVGSVRGLIIERVDHLAFNGLTSPSPTLCHLND